MHAAEAGVATPQGMERLVPAQPLPTPCDGTFKTDVSVLGVTKQEPGAAP